jgi:hypothetical protein
MADMDDLAALMILVTMEALGAMEALVDAEVPAGAEVLAAEKLLAAEEVLAKVEVLAEAATFTAAEDLPVAAALRGRADFRAPALVRAADCDAFFRSVVRFAAASAFACVALTDGFIAFAPAFRICVCLTCRGTVFADSAFDDLTVFLADLIGAPFHVPLWRRNGLSSADRESAAHVNSRYEPQTPLSRLLLIGNHPFIMRRAERTRFQPAAAP